MNPALASLRIAGEHAEDDRVIALMMRLATVGIDLSSAGAGVKSEETAKADPKTNLTGGPARPGGRSREPVVTIYKVAAVSFTLFYLFCFWRLIRFTFTAIPRRRVSP